MCACVFYPFFHCRYVFRTVGQRPKGNTRSLTLWRVRGALAADAGAAARAGHAHWALPPYSTSYTSHHINPECAGPSTFLPSRSPLARATNFRTGEPGRRQKRRWPKRRRPKRRRPKRGRRRATADPKRRGRGGGRGSADGGKAAGGSLRRASAGKGTMEGRN